MRMRLMSVMVCVVAHTSLFPVLAQADADAGKSVFNQCAGCHAVGPDAQHRFGPQLNGLMTRGAGAASGYDYSAAFSSKVGDGMKSWDQQTLDAYLAAPMSYMPGTKMAYPGLGSAEDRANVIAYLETLNVDGSIVGAAPVQLAEVRQEAVEIPPRPLAKDVPVPEHGVLHLGRPAMEEEVLAWDIDIRPDGLGLPPGSGSVESGGVLYDAQCASCHGVFGEGEGRWPILAGGQGSLQDERPEKTIGSYWPYLSTVYDYVRRAMPFGNARSLSDDDVYAITAYLLYLNDIVDEGFVLDSESFADIEMPNEANFIADNRSDEPWIEAGQELCMTDCIEGVAKVVMRARILDVTPGGEDNEGAGGVD